MSVIVRTRMSVFPRWVEKRIQKPFSSARNQNPVHRCSAMYFAWNAPAPTCAMSVPCGMIAVARFTFRNIPAKQPTPHNQT